MSREKFAWVTSVVLVALLAFQLPGTLAHRDDDYAFVGQLLTIHRQVADNYVEPVDEDKLRAGAINGMLSQLDPYTVYVPPSQEEAFDRLLEGSYKGVGIQLDQDKETKESFTDEEGEELLRGFMSGELFKHGLICRADDRGDPVIQLSPPLVADNEEFEIIDRVLRQVLTEAWDRIVRH